MDIQVVVAKAAFGRLNMIAQIGNSVFKHAFLFGEAHRARAEAQAARIQDLLARSPAPEDELNAEFWEGPGKGFGKKQRIFKPAVS